MTSVIKKEEFSSGSVGPEIDNIEVNAINFLISIMDPNEDPTQIFLKFKKILPSLFNSLIDDIIKSSKVGSKFEGIFYTRIHTIYELLLRPLNTVRFCIDDIEYIHKLNLYIFMLSMFFEGHSKLMFKFSVKGLELNKKNPILSKIINIRENLILEKIKFITNSDNPKLYEADFLDKYNLEIELWAEAMSIYNKKRPTKDHIMMIQPTPTFWKNNFHNESIGAHGIKTGCINLAIGIILELYPELIKEKETSSIFNRIIEVCLITFKYDLKADPTETITSVLSGFLHDCGKPGVTTLFELPNEKGKKELCTHFKGHGENGSSLLDTLLPIDFLDREILISITNNHMLCGYHFCPDEIFSDIKCEHHKLYCLNPKYKKIMQILSIGDSFGSSRNIDPSYLEILKNWIEKIESPNKNFLEKIMLHKEVSNMKFCIKLEGVPRSGKTTTGIEIKMILKSHGIDSELISRDDCMMRIVGDKIISSIEKYRHEISTSPLGGLPQDPELQKYWKKKAEKLKIISGKVEELTKMLKNPTYHAYYQFYKDNKLGRIVNKSFSDRIDDSSSNGVIPIIDTCASGRNLRWMIPKWVNNSLIFSVWCKNDLPRTEEDAVARGMSILQLNQICGDTTLQRPIGWMFSRNKLGSGFSPNISDYCKQMRASSEYAIQSTKTNFQLRPILTSTACITQENQTRSQLRVDCKIFADLYKSSKNEQSLILFDCPNKIIKLMLEKFMCHGLDWSLFPKFCMDNYLSYIGFRMSFDNEKPIDKLGYAIIKVDYILGGHNNWGKGTRNLRGKVFIVNFNDQSVRSLIWPLQRGAEINPPFNSHAENILVGESKNNEAYIQDDPTSKFDIETMKTISLFQKEFTNEDLYLTSKVDGSICNVTVFDANSIEGQVLMNSIETNDSEFAKMVLDISLSISSGKYFVWFRSRNSDKWQIGSTLISAITENVNKREEVKKLISNGLLWNSKEIIDFVMPEFIAMFLEFYSSVSNSNETFFFEIMLKNRTCLWNSYHTELACAAEYSTMVYLGRNSKNGFFPHCHDDGKIPFIQPIYWVLAKGSPIIHIKNLVYAIEDYTLGNKSQEEVLRDFKPQNKQDFLKILAPEGFVVFRGEKYDYAKLKLWLYYLAHSNNTLEKYRIAIKANEICEDAILFQVYPSYKLILDFYTNIRIKLINFRGNIQEKVNQGIINLIEFYKSRNRDCLSCELTKNLSGDPYWVEGGSKGPLTGAINMIHKFSDDMDTILDKLKETRLSGLLLKNPKIKKYLSDLMSESFNLPQNSSLTISGDEKKKGIIKNYEINLDSSSSIALELFLIDIRDLDDKKSLFCTKYIPVLFYLEKFKPIYQLELDSK